MAHSTRNANSWRCWRPAPPTAPCRWSAPRQCKRVRPRGHPPHPQPLHPPPTNARVRPMATIHLQSPLSYPPSARVLTSASLATIAVSVAAMLALFIHHSQPHPPLPPHPQLHWARSYALSVCPRVKWEAWRPERRTKITSQPEVEPNWIELNWTE